MRIDPKYFNVFLMIVALVAAILIAVFTFKNRINDQSAFNNRMAANDSLQTIYWHSVHQGDSLRIADFKKSFVVLNFWTDRSDVSLESQQMLARLKDEYSDTLEVISAAVGLKREEAMQYIADHNFPFHFVAGSQQFSDLAIPGLPAQLVYNPQGELESVFLGYQNQSQYDSLRALITYDNKQ